MWRYFLIIPVLLLLIMVIGNSAGMTPAPGPVINGVPGYDVIVVGGDPEGVAAALSAARNGLKTLLIEESETLGGLFTRGMLNFIDLNHGPDGELLNGGIFGEFFRDMGNAFDIEEAERWFMRKIQREPNITLKLSADIIAPIMDGLFVTGITLCEAGETIPYYSLRLIDATPDADIAAMARTPYTVGGEDYGEAASGMGVTLVFELSGVDWDVMLHALKTDGNKATDGDQKSAWGFGKEAAQYKPQDPMMKLRGPNLARQRDDNVLVNALLIFGVDGLDSQSKQDGIQRGLKEIPYIVEFMRENFPGFSNAEFVKAAESLYVRETRHILGEYRLSIDDVLENRDFWDRIAQGSYPVDIQATSPDSAGHVVGWPALYSIPFRCLVPQRSENLLVASRSAAYDSLPHGSARVVPVGMAVGEAAGAAAAWSIRNSKSFREMSYDQNGITWLQDRLKRQGVRFSASIPPEPTIMKHWAYDGLKVMRALGLAEGGYANEYGLNRLATGEALRNRLNRILKLTYEKAGLAEPRVTQVPERMSINSMLINVAWSVSGEELDFEAAFKLLKTQGILSEEFIAHMGSPEDHPSVALVYTLLAGLYRYYYN